MISLLQSPPSEIHFLRALGFKNKQNFINKVNLKMECRKSAPLRVVH